MKKRHLKPSVKKALKEITIIATMTLALFVGIILVFTESHYQTIERQIALSEVAR